MGAPSPRQQTKFSAPPRAALDSAFGAPVTSFTSYPQTNGDPDHGKARDLLQDASRALSSASQFKAALESENVFASLSSSIEEDQVDDIFQAVPFALTVRFDYTDHNYTRFGAWADTTRADATDDTPAVSTTVFAYSPLSQTNYSSDPGLNFKAVYEGDTIAVDDEGAIYKGFIQVAVVWNSSPTANEVSSFIRDLRDIKDNSWFQHADQDVSLIGFSGMGANDTGLIEITGDPSRAWVQYRNDGVQEDIDGIKRMTGKFVHESIDGPLAVIGEWSLAEGSRYKAIKGAFGAELVP